MKKFNYIILSLLLFCFLNSKLIAQCDNYPNAIPLPEMHVKKESAILWMNEFYKYRFLRGSKYAKLTKHNRNFIRNGNEAFVFTFNAITNLLNKIPGSEVRVHLARFNEKDRTDITGIQSNTVVLLFASDPGLNPDKYYLINNGNDQPYEIEKDKAEAWINSYKTKNIRYLRGTIRRRHLDNYPDGIKVRSGLSDTQSILYDKQKMKQAFIDERDYQIKYHSVTLEAFRVVFSAYTPEGRIPTKDDTSINRRRLFIQFDYMEKKADGSFSTFYLDDQDDYDCRYCKSNPDNCKNGISKLSIQQKEMEKSVDNGQLCPTNCPK